LRVIISDNLVEENVQVYERMRDELVKKHHGKVAVFYRGELVTVQDDVESAIAFAKKRTRGKDFFVQPLYSPEEQAASIL
jgi:hypothetical protein